MANWYVSQKVAFSGAGTSLAVAFKTIAEAITAAADDDTIYVYSGVYFETLSINKTLSINGVGYVIMDGGSYHSIGFFISADSKVLTLSNFKIENYISHAIRSAEMNQMGLKISKCYIDGNIRISSQLILGSYLYDSVVKNCILSKVNDYDFGSASITYNNLTVINSTLFTTTTNHVKNNFDNSKLYIKNANPTCLYSNFYNSKLSFNGTFVAVNNIDDIIALLLSQIAVVYTNQFPNSKFLTALFNNQSKNNYTLKYDVANNPIAFATFAGTAIGAFQASANVVCKDTANGGDCDVYNITTDLYGLGIFGGKTNVGVIDNTNEKLYRTSDGINNWGVFVASTELPKTHVIRNLQMFGTIIDRNGGQVSKTPADFAYNYQIDVLVKWSDALSKSALLAETSRPFVRFRLRPDGTNYYVNNSGTLVGDGEPTYLSLVNSTDGGSGSLVPTKVTAKSFVCIIILQDV